MSEEGDFVVVAMGSAAGGLAALQAFFGALHDADVAQGAAFLVILHLPPEETGDAAADLANAAPLPVHEVSGAVRLAPGAVYLAPPDRAVTLSGDLIEARPRGDGSPAHPVDDLFAALGSRYGRRTIGIILSGTGSSGSHGLTVIKEHGGAVFAQDPDTADFADMPRAAIETGHVDRVLAPASMPAAIAACAAHIAQAAAAATPERTEAGSEPQSRGRLANPEASTDRAFAAILDILRAHAGLDLRQYKTGTLQRRIDRRVALHRLPDRAAYAAMLRGSHEERDALAADVLITVTSFFRDGAAWDCLRDAVVRPLVNAGCEEQPIRAWVAGCASGEEAYSLGMLLFEEMEAQGRTVALEIFATDAAVPMLARARQGRYPLAAVQHLSDRRRERFFRRENDTVRVRHELREAIVFAPQDLVQDPPFSRLDLVVCRNLLIYLKPELQQKVIRLFHFALREGGFLFLGPAENIGSGEEIFEPVSSQHRIYRTKAGLRRNAFDFPVPRNAYRTPRLEGTPQRDEQPRRRGATTVERAARILADVYAPPSIIVDRDLTALFYHGATERFLKPQMGEPTHDLSVLLLDGLSLRLRDLAERARESRRRQEGIARATVEGEPVRVRIEVTPRPDEEGEGGVLVVGLVEQSEAEPRAAAEAETSSSSREQELEAEVAQLRDELRRTMQASHQSQEELKSYNEEVVSMNEELRSANEELETSKEELQSLNEELNTVNKQLRAKVDELHERTGDLDNLLSSTEVGTLFLDSELCIRWFSSAMAHLFNIREQDTGRPVGELKPRFEDPSFLDDAREVLRHHAPVERQVRADHGRRLLRRTAPYRTLDDRIDGVVVTFTDVTAIQNARDYAETILETVPLPFVVLDVDLRVLSASPAFYETFRVRREDTDQRYIYDLGNGQWNIAELRRLLGEVLPSDKVFTGYEVTHTFETVGTKTMKLNGRRLEHLQLILLAIEDVTEERAAQARVAESEERMRALVNATSYIVFRMSPDWKEMWRLDGNGLVEDLCEPRTGWIERYIHPADQPLVREKIAEAVRTKSMFDLEHRVLRPDGSAAWTRSRAVPLLDERGEIREWFGAASDVTARKQAEGDRELLVAELNHRMKNILSVIRGLATLSGENATDGAEYRERFLARLDALIRAHNLALGSGAQGIDLAVLSTGCLEPYAGPGRQRVTVEGGAVRLDSRRSVALALVLHELATNAMKHGSLSDQKGTVRLSWTVTEEDGGALIALEWREADGPEVRPPDTVSFGLRMIERVLTFDLGGTAQLDFRREGLVLKAAFPA